jgi:serine phosphatase RsbU (regulator of sigma subunit)
MSFELPISKTLEHLQKKERYLEVIYKFATALLEAQSIDEVVWTVAKNAIAQLGYVDCVIYLTDDDGKYLIQRAAHGPKNPIALDIMNPIRLKFGEGVVGHVAKSKKGEIVTDTSKDPRYVIDDDMRLSEIAVPIIHNKKVIGVIDSEHPERNFYPHDDLQILETIASMTATKLEQTKNNDQLLQLQDHLQQLVRERTEDLEKALAEVHRQKSEITDSIHYAKRIQTAILPPARLFKDNLKQSFVLYRPKDIVAGDFYWLEREGDEIFIAVADCTGHGVPGAMVSVVCHSALNRAVKEFKLKDPAEVLNKVRELVIETFEKSDDTVSDGMDIGLCVLDVKKQTIRYSGAYIPLYIVSNDKLIEIKADKQPIGKHAVSTTFTTHLIELEKGDCIYMLSDGFADQFGGSKGKKFRSKALKDLILKIAGLSIAQQKKHFEKLFDEWKGSLEQVDDVTILAIKI